MDLTPIGEDDSDDIDDDDHSHADDDRCYARVCVCESVCAWRCVTSVLMMIMIWFGVY